MILVNHSLSEYPHLGRFLADWIAGHGDDGVTVWIGAVADGTGTAIAVRMVAEGGHAQGLKLIDAKYDQVDPSYWAPAVRAQLDRFRGLLRGR